MPHKRNLVSGLLDITDGSISLIAAGNKHKTNLKAKTRKVVGPFSKLVTYDENKRPMLCGMFAEEIGYLSSPARDETIYSSLVLIMPLILRLLMSTEVLHTIARLLIRAFVTYSLDRGPNYDNRDRL